MAEELKDLKAANKDLKAENKELKDALSMLMEQVKALQDKIDAVNTAPAPVPVEPKKVSPYDNVVVVHLIDNFDGGTTHIDLSNTTIDMVNIGETRTLTLGQFEELVGKYRSWFTRGVITVAAGYEEYAVRNNIAVDYSQYVTNDFLANLGTLPMNKVEEMYNKVCQGQKDFIVSYWKRQIIKQNPAFMDLSKVQRMDGISGGQFEYELKNLSK